MNQVATTDPAIHTLASNRKLLALNNFVLSLWRLQTPNTKRGAFRRNQSNFCTPMLTA